MNDICEAKDERASQPLRCEIMQVARFVSILATLEDLLVLEMAQFALLRERRLQYRSSTY